MALATVRPLLPDPTMESLNLDRDEPFLESATYLDIDRALRLRFTSREFSNLITVLPLIYARRDLLLDR